MKKTTSSSVDKRKDIEKLKVLTDEKNGYCYVLGIYFELDIINFFVDGEEI